MQILKKIFQNEKLIEQNKQLIEQNEQLIKQKELLIEQKEQLIEQKEQKEQLSKQREQLSKQKEQKEHIIDNFILCVIILNAGIIFAQESGYNALWLQIADLVCTLIFIVEMVVKQCVYGIRGYWHDGWNCLDGVLVILSLPSLVAFFVPAGAIGNLSILLVMRLLRVLRFFRIVHIFPASFQVIVKNFGKALRDCSGVFVSFGILIIIVALVSCALFRDSAPEYFSTPVDSIYSTQVSQVKYSVSLLN